MDTKKVTIREVARLAGVSVSTVGRVIGNYGYVSEEKRSKVEQAVEQLSYLPNAVAQSLRSSNMKTIGIMLGDIKNLFFSRMLSSIESAARQNGYSTIVCNTNDSIEQEVELLRVLYSKRVDGIILVSSYKSGQHIKRENHQLYEGDIPIVYADRKVDGTTGEVVAIDNWQGGYDGMAYLMGLGHRKIGIVAPPEFVTVESRIAGCKAAMEQAGNPFLPKRLVRFESECDVLSNWLDANPDLTAFFLLNSDGLGTLISELHNRKLIIPDDISLITWDDCEIARFTQCTIMEQPVEQMGKVAVERLMAQIENGENRSDVIEDVYLKAHLVERKSCKIIDFQKV